LTDEPSGFSHPRCYARASKDCSSKLTSEHWLSSNLLRELEPLTVGGLRWHDGESTIRAKALGSNILCDRHNRALSPLDDAAGEVFRVLRHFQADLRTTPDPHGPEFALFDGETVERWLLKVFWGCVTSGNVKNPDGALIELPDSIPAEELTQVLFRGQLLPDGWGLYMTTAALLFRPTAEIDLSGITGPDGKLAAGELAIGPFVLRFSFGLPPEFGLRRNRHPQAIFIRSEVSDVQKVFAMGWQDSGNRPIILSRVLDEGNVTSGPLDV